MTHELLLKNIHKHILPDAAETGYFISLLAYKEIPKKTRLLKAGQACKNISYVHAGAVRAYYTDAAAKESTIMFAVADWWITDMYCFLNNKPAIMDIEAIEDSCVFQLSRENLDRLYIKVPKFERFFRILMQNAYTREQLRIIENLSLPALDRYNNFLLKYPHIAQQVTQKQIASYLGITPEFLSAVRKTNSRKKIS
jgi:CRP-like cAMP-binding protein